MYHAYEHYVIKNVELWTERDVIAQCDIEVQNGFIKAIEEHIAVPKSAHLIDGCGWTLLTARMYL